MRTIRFLPFLLLMFAGIASADVYYKSNLESKVERLEAQAWHVVKVVRYRTGGDSDLTRRARHFAREARHFKHSISHSSNRRVRRNFRRLADEFYAFNEVLWRDYVARRYGYIREDARRLRRRFHRVQRTVFNYWGLDRYYNRYRRHEYHNFGY